MYLLLAHFDKSVGTFQIIDIADFSTKSQCFWCLIDWKYHLFRDGIKFLVKKLVDERLMSNIDVNSGPIVKDQPALYC